MSRIVISLLFLVTLSICCGCAWIHSDHGERENGEHEEHREER